MKPDTKKLIVKSISWRVFSTVQSCVVTFLVTGSLENTLKLIVAFNITGLIMYYIHEKLWERFK